VAPPVESELLLQHFLAPPARVLTITGWSS